MKILKYLEQHFFHLLIIFILLIVLYVSALGLARVETISQNQADIDEVWRMYQSDELSFIYPAELTDMKLIEDFGVTTSKYDFNRELYKDNYPNVPFKINFYPVGYELINNPFGGRSDILSKPINIETAEADLNKEYHQMDSIIAFKKLSDKSVFVMKYGNYECSPSWSIEVIAPLNNSKKYSNVIVEVSDRGEYFPKDTPSEEFDCSYEIGVNKVAKKILDGTANKILMDNIEQARIIAESAAVK